MASDKSKFLALGGEMLRFGMVGISATLVHVLVALAVEAIFGLPAGLCNLAGFAAAVTLSFVGHLRFSFRRSGPGRPYLARFIALSLLSLGTSSLITAVATALGAGLAIAMLGVAGIVPLMSYLSARLWAFAPPSEAHS